MSAEAQIRTDMEFLNSRPEFRRFMWRTIQMAGIFDRVTDGSEGRHLAYYEGRRNLGLELLADAEQGQPAAHPDGIPILTAIQILREEAQQKPTETKNGRRNRDRYDRHRDLDDGGDGDGPGADDDREG